MENNELVVECKEKDRCYLYYEGDFTSEEADLFEKHLVSCSACRDTMESLDSIEIILT